MKQYKDYKSAVEDVDEKGRVLVAANAIGNVDADEDRSLTGSFNKTLKENFSRLKWFQNHDKNLLIGVPIEGKEQAGYLKMLGQLNLNKQLGKDIYEDYKLYAEYGKTLEHSIGVEAVKFQMNGNIRDVSEWKLWEYSTLTSWGANWNTPMMGIKSMNDLSAIIDLLELKLKKGNYSDEKFADIEKSLLLFRSLCTEPGTTDDTTRKTKPNAEPDLAGVIQQFCLIQKISTNGRESIIGGTG